LCIRAFYADNDAMTIRKEIYTKHVSVVPAGKIVFSEGDPGDAMYIIIQGEIEISKRTSLETSKTLITLKAGDIFGEMAVIEKKPRSATAIATQESRLLYMDENLFFTMIEKNPDFAVKIVRVLSERIRRSNSLIQALSSTNREALVLSGIKDYSLANGVASIKGHRIQRDKFILWATHHIGLSEREVSEAIHQLIAKGIIRLAATPGEMILPVPK
jgi:CRP/FNR family transcriptional regulator, cyclic AMP receptor protein